MKECFQTEGQTILDHGLAVWKHYKRIIRGDMNNMRIPQWYSKYKDQIINNLHDIETIQKYTVYHDCGKPFCLEIDEHGKRHFPDHARISKTAWLNAGGDEATAELIGLDMIMHTENAEQIISRRLSTKTICTLLISALAEIHANAQMFGGVESESFKIKFKRLEKKGMKICKEYFDHPYMYILVRNDLSAAQKSVQGAHATIEATRRFIKSDDRHPSLIFCIVKSEQKLKMVCEEIKSKGIQFAEFYEPDIGNQLTAIATEPLNQDLRNIFLRFQLLN